MRTARSSPEISLLAMADVAAVVLADRPTAHARYPAAVTAGNVASTHPVVAAAPESSWNVVRVGRRGKGGGCHLRERRDPPGRAVPDVAVVVVAVRASALLGQVPAVAPADVAGTHPVVVAAPEVARNVVRVR